MNLLNSQERKGYLQIFLAGALWSTIGPFIMTMSRYGSTLVFTSFLRMAIASVILFAVTVAKFGLSALRISKKELFLCALLGLICQGIYNVFYSLAVTLTGVAISAVLLNLAPVFTAIMAGVIFSEKITWLKTLALFVNVFGCVLAATGGSLDARCNSWIGILYGVGAGFCYSLTAIIGRFAGEKSNVFVVSTYSYIFASLFLAVFMHPWKMSVCFNGKLLAVGLLFALIPTAIAYLFYYSGVQKITETSKVPVIASVETILAAMLGIVFYNERMGLANLAGIFLVIGSIILTSCRTEKNQKI
ncbi:hypothetical protein A7X67_08960 [Clostridium sp. W14A]|nr:hypothetical protein A7X67_08960 [Clostridium sp. W14A]